MGLSLLGPRGSVSSLLRVVAVVSALLSVAAGQRLSHSRVSPSIDENVRVTLKGNVRRLPAYSFDRGAVADSFPARRMLLVLQRSAERQQALEDFLREVHTPGSPRYHKWMTPEEFGRAFGPDDSELTVVSAWLHSHGFAVARATRGKTAIEFSGTARQVRDTFRTQIHSYAVNGETRYAADSDPQVPAALAPVIAGITPLNNFRPKPQAVVLGKAAFDPLSHELVPQWTTPFSSPLLFALAPGDFAVQYDLNPLYKAGVDGTGVTIGVISAADVDPNVYANYRSFFGLPAPKLNSIIDGTDPTPGQGNWATEEAYLDVEVAGSVAPGATINLYTAADTSVQSGLLLAAERAVDDDQAAVLSTSYGLCEADLGSAGNQFWANLWEQAAAQGQTSFVSSGDNGSAGCDDFNVDQPAQRGLAVNGISSTPWNVSVGGTDFFYNSYFQSSSAQSSEVASYWNLSVSNFPTTSLLQRIPEQPWNRPFGLNLGDGGIYDASNPNIIAGSGGASSFYSKPSWQSGNGVPADGKRDLPDISLFAAPEENYSFYPICLGGDCVQWSPGAYSVTAVGGTSASSPAMAGIMALVDQKYGLQGQANRVFYPLAVQHPTAFHDVTIGSNNVPCTGGTGCTVSTLNNNTKGFSTLGHYYSGAGYDLATGLGSVDANLLVQYWNSLSFKLTKTVLSANQTTFTHGTPIAVNVSVTGDGGTPTGDVGLVSNASPALHTSIGKVALSGGSAVTTLTNLPGGSYQLTAKYGGDTVFAASNSDPVSFNVSPEPSTVALSGVVWNQGSSSFAPISAGAAYPYGTYIAIDARPRGTSSSNATATGTVSFADSMGNVNSGALGITNEGFTEWVPGIALPVGTNSVTVSYSGDPSFTPSISAPLTFTVSRATPHAVLLSKPSPVAVGSPTTLSMQLSGPYSAPQPAPPNSTFNLSSPLSPTGAVTFSSANAVLGTATVVPSSNGLLASTASLDVSSLPVGSNVVTATYNGDSNYNGTTTSFNVVVEQAAALSATANPNPITTAEYTAITATVAGGKGMALPTGTVTFSVPAGSSHWWTDTEPLQNGTATSKGIAGISVGANSVAVSYSGDSVYGPADTVLTFNVLLGGSPFTLKATPITIAAGATTANISDLTVTPQNGFTGTVYLSCILASSPAGAQNLPNCSVPASVNIANTNAVSAGMTVLSTAATSAWLVPARWWISNAGLFAGVVLLAAVPHKRKRSRVRLFVVTFMGLLSLLACGGGTAGNVGAVKSLVSGTTPGAYTFTVGASLTPGGVYQAQTPVTVTVQ